MLTDVEKLLIATGAHEINRAYCEALGDQSQPEWAEAPEWQKESACAGVEFHLNNPDAGPEASHESWLRQKVRDGWTYGRKMEPEKKTHPCLVPFDKLPVAQRAKDHLFRAVVHTMSYAFEANRAPEEGGSDRRTHIEEMAVEGSE